MITVYRKEYRKYERDAAANELRKRNNQGNI